MDPSVDFVLRALRALRPPISFESLKAFAENLVCHGNRVLNVFWFKQCPVWTPGVATYKAACRQMMIPNDQFSHAPSPALWASFVSLSGFWESMVSKNVMIMYCIRMKMILWMVCWEATVVKCFSIPLHHPALSPQENMFHLHDCSESDRSSQPYNASQPVLSCFSNLSFQLWEAL